ncbi:MAG: adenylate/guanylate cyclase domain-containing protein [Proteobacteria bacterium]|nr:adenylate/guanylate cyclase domain-containing protein [Pseudomonadota bacterium]
MGFLDRIGNFFGRIARAKFGRIEGIVIPLGLLLAALTLRPYDPPIVQQMRNLVFDSYQRIAPRQYDSTLPIRIGDIDEKSLNTFGQWPWSRSQMARIIDRLRELGAAVVGIDIIYAEPDRTAPAAIAKNLPTDGSFDTAKEMLLRLPDPDQDLANSIAQIPTIIPFAALGTDPQRPQNLPLRKAGYAFAGDNPVQYIRPWRFWVTSLPELEKAATGIGSVNADPDPDGIIRQVSLFLQLPDKDNPTPFYPSMTAEAIRIAQGQTTYAVKSSGASGVISFGEHTGISVVKIGQALIPTNSQGAVILYDTGHQKERFFSLADLMSPDFDPSIVAGRIIFIGSSSEGLRDYKPTPNEESMTGVEIHAQIAEQIFGGTYLQRPDWADGLEFVTLAALGVILTILAQLRRALVGFGIAAFGIIGSFGASYYLFITRGFELDPLYPAGAAFLIFVTATLIGYIRTEQEKAQVRGAFSLYLSPVLVDQVSKNREQLKLGGENRDLTVMFCDIRGFTKMSEGLDPQQLTHVINQFLTPMTDIIQANGGTIDKYIGDCIMAFWNAPLDIPQHERKAVTAAYGMRSELVRLNETLAAEAAATGAKKIEIKIGIGLNTGIACVGNMGSKQRFGYSALGDTVNTASRLESLSPAYFVDLVLGEETALASAGLALLELDQVRVKGKNLPVRIYTGLGDEKVAQSNSFVALKSLHDAMLGAYRDQSWSSARASLALAREAAPEALAKFYDMYEARITDYATNPPPKDWDGVYVAMTKGG